MAVQPNLTQIFTAQADDALAEGRRETFAEIARLQDKIRQNPTQPDLYLSLAGLYRHFGEQSAAEAVLRDGIAVCTQPINLYWRLIHTLKETGKTQEAIALACSATRNMPRGLQFRFAQYLTLPVLYETNEEVATYRRHFAEGLKASEDEILAASPEELSSFLEGLKRFTNFYLAYQGYDDLSLQKRYGILVNHIIKACYPEWTLPLSMPSLSQDGRVRVGYVSSFFYNHTVAKLFIGWLEHCDRTRFKIHSYYSRRLVDSMTQRVRNASELFYHISDDFEAICKQILEDRLHVLIFTDIGMSAKTTMLAALRLAPVQCMAWGHPVTSGLASIDYFLSSELMEPPDGQQQYSERLVLLPGVGVCIDKPVVPRPFMIKTRANWGIPEDATVYLCCQSLFKYLPHNDRVFPTIAHSVPKAKFVFIARRGVPCSRFWTRLQRAFSTVGLYAEDYCLLLPDQSYFEYWNLNLVSDVFLDSVGWSGGITSLEAIACGLPIVTLPGKFMRGRHSYAMLAQLGITETIAVSETNYIDIAVRLGLDTTWRKAIVQKIGTNNERLYSDVRNVRALEQFIEGVIAARLSRQHAG